MLQGADSSTHNTQITTHDKARADYALFLQGNIELLLEMQGIGRDLIQSLKNQVKQAKDMGMMDMEVIRQTLHALKMASDTFGINKSIGTQITINNGDVIKQQNILNNSISELKLTIQNALTLDDESPQATLFNDDLTINGELLAIDEK